MNNDLVTKTMGFSAKSWNIRTLSLKLGYPVIVEEHGAVSPK